MLKKNLLWIGVIFAVTFVGAFVLNGQATATNVQANIRFLGQSKLVRPATITLATPATENKLGNETVIKLLTEIFNRSTSLQITEPGWYHIADTAVGVKGTEVTEYWFHIGADGLMFESAMRVTLNNEVTQYGITVNGISWNNSGTIQNWGTNRFPFTLGNNWINSIIDYAQLPGAVLQENPLTEDDEKLQLGYYDQFITSTSHLKRFSVVFPLNPPQPNWENGPVFDYLEHSIVLDSETGLGFKIGIIGITAQGERIHGVTQTETLTKIAQPPQDVLDLLARGIPEP